MTGINVRSAEGEEEVKANMPFSLPTAPFPDKKREHMADRYQPNSPKVRAGVNPLFFRRMSSSGYSSNDETPTKLRRVTSVGSNPDCSRPVKYLFGTPEASEGVPVETAFLSRLVMSEITKDVENDENRPPSPRPSDPLQVYVEHNKQLQVWDDWVVMANSGVEPDVACVSYRRTESLHAPESLPKSLKPPSLSDSKWDN